MRVPGLPEHAQCVSLPLPDPEVFVSIYFQTFECLLLPVGRCPLLKGGRPWPHGLVIQGVLKNQPCYVPLIRHGGFLLSLDEFDPRLAREVLLFIGLILPFFSLVFRFVVCSLGTNPGCGSVPVSIHFLPHFAHPSHSMQNLVPEVAAHSLKHINHTIR